MLSAIIVNRLFKKDGLSRYMDPSNAGNISPNAIRKKRLK